MRVLFINNDGAGFADHVEVAEGISVAEFFVQHVRHGNPADYLIRVNRQCVAADQKLADGDRITVTPLKIEGARHD